MKEVKKLRKEKKDIKRKLLKTGSRRLRWVERPKNRKALQKAERQVKLELRKIKLKKKAKTWNTEQLTKMGQDKEDVTKKMETQNKEKDLKLNTFEQDKEAI